MNKHVCLVLAVVLSQIVGNIWAESLLKPGDTLAICGDSITEQKQYSVFIEDYILMCQPVKGVKTIQFGWGGDHATAFSTRMKDYVTGFHPTVVTTCYGMNDGTYKAIDDAIEQKYRTGLAVAAKNFKAAGARAIVIGSPGAVDTTTFKKPNATPEVYNHTLGRLGEVASEVANSEGVVYADIHNPMMEVMGKAKEKYGSNYLVAGSDGVHPFPNGHLIMAQAFLKAMGFDGNIGTITYDASKGTTVTTDNHKVLSSKVGEIELESGRYPFCFYGSPTEPDGNVSILPFVTFNAELNRYMLIAKNLKSPKATVTWGSESKEFTAAQLSAGINLAAEFLKNPFVAAFMEVDKQVRNKQDFETMIFKNYFPREGALAAQLPAEKNILNEIHNGFIKVHSDFLDICAKTVRPVIHTIKIQEGK